MIPILKMPLHKIIKKLIKPAITLYLLIAILIVGYNAYYLNSIDINLDKYYHAESTHISYWIAKESIGNSYYYLKPDTVELLKFSTMDASPTTNPNTLNDFSTYDFVPNLSVFGDNSQNLIKKQPIYCLVNGDTSIVYAYDYPNSSLSLGGAYPYFEDSTSGARKEKIFRKAYAYTLDKYCGKGTSTGELEPNEFKASSSKPLFKTGKGETWKSCNIKRRDLPFLLSPETLEILLLTQFNFNGQEYYSSF